MTPAELLLGLVLTGTQSHYEFRGVVDDKRLEHLLLAGKQILYKSHQESDVRYVNYTASTHTQQLPAIFVLNCLLFPSGRGAASEPNTPTCLLVTTRILEANERL